MTDNIDCDRDEPAQDTLEDLIDPAALEARLVVARARRAEVLAARAKEPRGAHAERRSPAPWEATTPDASMQGQGGHDPEAAGSGSGTPPFPVAAGKRKPPTANGRQNRIGDTASQAPRRSVVAFDEFDRRMPLDLGEAPGEATRPVAPDRAQSGKRRSSTLVAAMLVSGVTVGVVSTLFLQSRGWQIAIVPPAAEGVQEQAAKPETLQAPVEILQAPVETAEAERLAVPPPQKVEDPAVGPSGSEVGVTPHPAARDRLARSPSVASAEETAPAMVVRPTPAQLAGAISLPDAAPVPPVGTSNAQRAEVLRPAPVPDAAKTPQALTFNLDAPTLANLPEGAEPERLALGAGMSARLPPLPTPQVGASLSPPPPEDAGPSAGVVSPSSRVAVHFPVPSSAEADEVSAELSGEGYADVAAHPVSFGISSPHVRYYHDADRAAAENVAASVSATLDDAAVEARSFTGFRPRPEEGLLEVWLAGESPTPAPRAAATPSRTPVVSRRTADREAQRRVAERAAQRRLAEQEAQRQRLLGTVEQRLRSRLR